MVADFTVKQVALATAILTILACGGTSADDKNGALSINMPIQYNDGTAKSIIIQNPYGVKKTIDPIQGATDNVTLVFDRPAAGQPPIDANYDKATFKVYSSAGVYITSQTLQFTYGQAKTASKYDINWNGTVLTATPE